MPLFIPHFRAALAVTGLVGIIVSLAVFREFRYASSEHKTIPGIVRFAESDIVNSSKNKEFNRVFGVADVLEVIRQKVCSNGKYWGVTLENSFRPRNCLSGIREWLSSGVRTNKSSLLSSDYVKCWRVPDIGHIEPDGGHQFIEKFGTVCLLDRNAQIGPVRDLQCLLGNRVGSFSGLGRLLHLAQLAIVNRRDDDVRNEQQRINSDQPPFASLYISLKFRGYVFFLVGTALGLFSHFTLLWSKW